MSQDRIDEYNDGVVRTALDEAAAGVPRARHWYHDPHPVPLRNPVCNYGDRFELQDRNRPEIAQIGGSGATAIDVQPIARAAPFKANGRVAVTLSRERPETEGELAMMTVNLARDAALSLFVRLYECIEVCWPGSVVMNEDFMRLAQLDPVWRDNKEDG